MGFGQLNSLPPQGASALVNVELWSSEVCGFAHHLLGCIAYKSGSADGTSYHVHQLTEPLPTGFLNCSAPRKSLTVHDDGS